MKTIRVKSYNKLIEKIINEDSIRLDGNTSDYKGKLKKRITDAIRLAKECKIAAKKARDDGNIVDAEWLEKRAEDYETAAKTWNQDALDTEEDNSADSKDKEPSQSEVAQDAANAAKRAARDAQDAANDAQNNAKKLADAGHDASAAQAAADKAQEKANEAKKAAEEAQEHADEASKAETAGDKDKAKAEAKAAEDAQNKAEQAAGEANEAAEAANQKSASERAKDAAEAAEEAAKNTQTKANNAQKKADDLKAEGKDASEAQAEADKAKEKADQANKAAEEAKDHAEKADKAEKSGDTETANSEADKAEAAADGAKQAANSLSDDGEDGSDDSGNDSDSEGGSSSDSDNDSKSDSSSDSDSDSDKGSDSDGDSGDDSDDDYDDSDDDDENQSDNTPVKDIFADDEDIPSMPRMPSKGQEGQDPRDPTIDEIVKQLSKLEGEARRGAIAGLTDLVKKSKNESLAEAFSKGIREFSDEEWDDLNNETIDKINKIKQITTIDDVEGRKAKVKSWADNQVSRQELSDEESQNAQHDILQRRAKEQELDKYNNLSGIKDFELDFEGCIRDQVEMVMQDYLTYDEINPEYELEDVIMKTEVQRMIPDEAIPTIAVFFDKSGSCKYAIPTLNNAIATVKKKYVDTGMCKLDLYYFGDRVAYNDANAYVGGSTEAWPHIIETIKQGDYNNVIVMSDDDIENQNNHGESYTVTGCVWWLWVNGIRADKCVKELRGMQHNFEGEISAY